MRLWPRKQEYVDDLPRTHDIRFAAMFVLIFVTIIAAVYAVGFVVAGNRLPRGTTVAGIDVGGMTRGEARTELQEQLAGRIDTPISATALDQSFKLDPQLSGLTFDIEKTLSNGLSGERWDPRHMLKVVTGGGPLGPVVEVDQVEMQATLDRIAGQVDHDPVDAGVMFAGGEPTASTGQVGTSLDYSAAAAKLEQAFIDGDEEVTLPVTSVDPDVTTTEAARYVDEVAAPAVAGPVRIHIADVTRTIPPHVFAPALRTAVEDGELRLDANATLLAQRSRALLASLPHHPRNARIVFDDGRPVVVPSRNGVSVAPDDWASAVLVAARYRGVHRVSRAKVTPEVPALSTEQANALKVDQRVVSTEVRIPGRLVSDAAATAQRLDGALVRPRQTFSLRQRIGSPAAEAGTVVASALYSSAFRLGLGQITRIAPPSHVSGTEPGLDASLESGVDLSWQNDTPFGIYVRAFVSAPRRGSGDLVVQLWSSPYFHVGVTSSGRYDVVGPDVQHGSGADCVPRTGSPGFQVDVTRTIRAAGSGNRVEKTNTRYSPVATVVCSKH